MDRHHEPTAEEKTAEFSETTPIRTRLGFLLSVVGLVSLAGVAWSGMNQRVEAEAEARRALAASTTVKQAETDQRLRALELAQIDIAVVRERVDWIAKTLAEDRKRKGE